MTPFTATEPYCTPARLLVYHDAEQVADALRIGDDARPSYRAMVDDTREPGATVRLVLLAASGEVESAALAGKRYQPTDLHGLTGAGAEYLAKLTADLAFWRLMQRRQPGSADLERVPGAKQALVELDRLRTGERIFGLTETADAGLPKAIEPAASQPARTNGVVSQAGRLFGNRSRG